MAVEPSGQRQILQTGGVASFRTPRSAEPAREAPSGAARGTAPTAVSPAPALVRAEAEFIASLAGRSPRTASTYRTALARFHEFLVAARLDPAARRTDELDGAILERFYGWLTHSYGRDDRFTVATYVAGVRAFCRFLARRHYLAPDVTFEELRDNLREVMGRVPYRTPRIDPRLVLIVTHVDGLPLPPAERAGGGARLEVLRDRALVRTLFTTGMRREEVARLSRADVQDGRARQALVTGKGDKERVVFFDDAALAAIRAYLDARADRYVPLFLRHDLGRGREAGPGGRRWRLSPKGVWDVVKRYAAAVGVDATTHDFRHAKASVMLNRGAKLSEVQDILGHASPETTKKIYAHYETSHLRDVFDRYSASAEELAEALAEPPER
ncbi:MAG: tyrosine-type recombinase/integrase [Chloroflexi bacterium]|nr:tyrosine-type recombinase/integrase [Chloroflexota bacterium]